jgi:Fic family protein
MGAEMGAARYERPSEMEPMFPSRNVEGLRDLALDVVRRSSGLGALLRPELRDSVVTLLREMNSYYSNLIEGHFTHPLDIQRALRSDYSSDPAKRARQLESKAHVEVQQCIEDRLAQEPAVEICSESFLCWIHREFYTRLPEEFRVVKSDDGETAVVTPGELRDREVKVGEHVPPSSHALHLFLARFEQAYSPGRVSALDRVVAAAASHHRLAWIHPFLDGNGRVARLFTHAYLIRSQLDAHRLWTVSRGLSRRRDEYLKALAAADQQRRGDLDGRGNLSDEGLRAFCEFFLRTAADQITFMSQLLDLPGLERRVVGYAERRAALGQLRPEAGFLLRDVLARGEVRRGEASRITGLGERLARSLVSKLLAERLLVSRTSRDVLRLGFPAEVVPYYFPNLYPSAVEVSLDPQTRA